MSVHYSDKEDRYWIKDRDEVLWFDSSLEAQNAEREIGCRKSIEDKIAAWLRAAGYNQIAAAIEAGEYREKTNA